jgi:hypothetical protein
VFQHAGFGTRLDGYGRGCAAPMPWWRDRGSALRSSIRRHYAQSQHPARPWRLR